MKPLYPLFFLFFWLISIQFAYAFDILQPLPENPITPKDNPVTPAKAALGKMLFFDTRLSVDETVSCNSCHKLLSGGDDDGSVTRMPGRKIIRSAPTVWNAAYQTVQYWDGRAKSLESQTAEHLLDKQIMAMPSAEALENRIRAIPGYVTEFGKVYKERKSITFDNIVKAITSYERTLKTPNSAFDEYIRGNKKAISDSAKRGIKLFNETGCLACHFGINFAGPAPGPAFGMGTGFYELFPNYLGSEYDRKYELTKDVGRFYDTGDRLHLFMWRVPPLRNIALTAPYFHNGSVHSLEEAIRVMAKTQLDKKLTAQEVEDIKAFLFSLTGKFPDIVLPQLPTTPGKTVMTKQK